MFASVQFSYEFFVFESRLYSQIPVTLVITRAINVPSLSPDLATSVPVHRPLRKSVACTFASTFWFCWGQNASAAGHIRTCAQHVEKKRNENQLLQQSSCTFGGSRTRSFVVPSGSGYEVGPRITNTF
ncbi:hypothetical protein MPTK1_5g19900 [Marchantia polymorpha subsp. ruderalis]|uniref:Uncharacterized protein n=2 Tax=Marchantia polymorpha TaxID=3197 RepID=A0AAF6BK79_MARPO|nr:hypothetical protein MARPO_0206s0009 [Marchantia polymorpha]BBN12413.1 hypothetical protein Mp_5g19900 [Marchantia polymorpha subsp. ruderalis]|eukprot:PTQ27326.1 hypothetical protein MARPO_0206s0009 [Marchantia polymorpha]